MRIIEPADSIIQMRPVGKQSFTHEPFPSGQE